MLRYYFYKITAILLFYSACTLSYIVSTATTTNYHYDPAVSKTIQSTPILLLIATPMSATSCLRQRSP